MATILPIVQNNICPRSIKPCTTSLAEGPFPPQGIDEESRPLLVCSPLLPAARRERRACKQSGQQKLGNADAVEARKSRRLLISQMNIQVSLGHPFGLLGYILAMRTTPFRHCRLRMPILGLRLQNPRFLSVCI